MNNTKQFSRDLVFRIPWQMLVVDVFKRSGQFIALN